MKSSKYYNAADLYLQQCDHHNHRRRHRRPCLRHRYHCFRRRQTRHLLTGY